MPALSTINNKAIKYVERNTKKKFFKKPTIRYGRECNNSVRWKRGHIDKAEIVIDKDMSKYPFNIVIPPVAIHEVRENLGFQHGESTREAHKEANKLELKFVKTKGTSRSSEDIYNALLKLLGYTNTTKKEVIMPTYQGKEITATLQANTKAQLDKLISGLNRYARANHLETVKVLSKGKDPDGGYKAIIEAHNFNPFKIAKSKYDMRLSPEEKLVIQRDKIAIKKQKLANQKELHSIKMQKLQMKQNEAREKNAIAKQRLETARIKQQRKAVKGKSAISSMLTGFIDYEGKAKKQAPRPKSKKRKSQSQPRMVTLRMN